ncbi:MAG TPA: hypothetical protein GX509_05750 [Firmicutes bacterium]|nr:hypothetical protein [Bacillota bacterium]
MNRIYELRCNGKHWLGTVPLFNPKTGMPIADPPGQGNGYWIGAPSAIYDDETRRFYIYCRLRKPRGEGRGYECRIYESEDGITLNQIWKATKQDLNTESMERAALVKTPGGIYRLYMSYVDPADGRWRIDLLEAESPSKFDIHKRTKILCAADIGVEGVKDPYILIVGGKYYMFLSYAPPAPNADHETRKAMHATFDVYNTGITKSCTGLAVSLDGVNFSWIGDVLSPGDSGWDKYATRISSIIYAPPVFTAFYDGIPDVKDNYEEKTGLAISFDLVHFERLTPGGPILTSPNSPGTLRYIEVVPHEDKFYYFYEFARPDGSHDLRVSIV